MESFAPLIWIEADRKPAKYFLNSLNIHADLFPNRRRIVVTNSIYREYYKNVNVTTFALEVLQKSKERKKFDIIKKRWTHNKQQLNYWNNTTKRFFYLYEFLKYSKIEKSVHLEGDNLLLDSTFIDKFLKNRSPQLAYPKQSANIGCASILVINQMEALRKFLEFINLNWNRPDVTDMGLLGEFANKRKYANFLPSDFQTEVLNHIFDPVIIGRFFLGTDARNSRIPFSKRGLFDKSDESFNPSYHKLTIDKYMKIRIQSLLTGREIFLGNIHIHSKRIPKNINRLRKLLIKESNKKRNLVWKFGRIDFLVSAERIGSFVRRKLKMVNSEVRFR